MKYSPEQIKELEKKQGKFYSSEELKRFSFYLTRFESAKDQRGIARKEFDDKTYEQDYKENKLAYSSYRRKKKNDNEIRVTGPTTEKKMEVVINELLSSEFATELHAYDQDDTELEELGKAMTDVVKRTNEIEQDDDLKIDILQETLGQRALFVEEVFEIKTVVDKRRIESSLLGIETLKGGYKKEEYIIRRPKKNILSGLQIYLGNINLPASKFQEQPFLLKYEKISYSEAALLYGTWKNWKYVTPGSSGGKQHFEGAFDYRFGIDIDGDEVEILHYMCFPDDEYQIMINGTMMLEPQTPLPWEKAGYNIEMIITKPMHRYFAYGSSIVAQSKTFQALDDEAIRMSIRKFKQSMEPPLLVKTDKTLSKKMFDPAAITYGVSKDHIAPVIDHNGVNANDMNFVNFINEQVKEFIGQDNGSQGIGSKGNPTATEVVQLRTQALKMLGLSVFAIMNYHKKTTFLRLFNILENMTTPVDKKYDPVTEKAIDIFNKFTLNNSELGEGKNGKKVIQFIDRDLRSEEEGMIYDFEREQENRGKHVRIQYVNVKKIRALRLVWYAVVTQKFKDSSALKQAMFNDKIVQAVNIMKVTGTPINGAKVVEDFEKLWDAKDFFQKGGPSQAQEQGGGGEMENLLSNIDDLEKEQPGQDLKPSQEQKPSVNSLLGKSK